MARYPTIVNANIDKLLTFTFDTVKVGNAPLPPINMTRPGILDGRPDLGARGASRTAWRKEAYEQ
jgi:hypothetical protein